MNCTSEILHLIPLVQQQLEVTKKRNLLECVSFLSSTLLYLFLCSSDYSKLIAIEVKASSVDKQENEESKVVPD